MIKVSIENYKSIDNIQLDIKPVTILIGPPNSGKSNILEALYIAGIPGKLYMATMEYENNEELFCEQDGALGRILRITDPLDIFPDYTYENKPVSIKTFYKHPKVETSITLKPGLDKITLNLKVMLKENVVLSDINKIKDILEVGIVLSKYYNYCVELQELVKKARETRQSLSEEPRDQDIGELFLLLLLGLLVHTMLEKDKKETSKRYDISTMLLDSRLYSYSRYMLDTRFDKLVSCSENQDKCRVPLHVLAEDASNIAWIAYRNPNALRMLNKWLTEKLHTGIEVLVKTRPSIEFYDKPIEIKPSLVSDGVKRALYYILAVSSSISYANMKNVKTILLLEEPEAKLYPYIQDLILYWMEKAVSNGLYIVMTTHNPHLVDMVAERFTEDKLAIYYVYRDPDSRRTRVKRITSKELAKLTAYSPGDLLAMAPDEVTGEE